MTTSIFDNPSHLPGARATESAHRKIELQSPADLTYLIANLTRAAREKIDRHLPPDALPEGEDAMRRRVEVLVDEYIRNTFGLAKGSIEVNGMGAEEMEVGGEGEEIEAFDTKLAQRIQALNAQIENHTLQLANLRRTAPKETAEKFEESFKKASERDDERLVKGSEALVDEAKQAKVDVGEVERLEEIQATWQNGTESLTALKSGLGGTVAKMERAQQAVDFLEER
ncbi:uncharacterized protein LTR77_006087 [Saxophila tyrrhenica]|uniref:Kinetochore protein mis14 n=1 Tax=Saxophila tyrrhenica TaxID=1690608 RepID=A0AAV9P7D0_9PEZI|nr:hypothetical protein LTR77_006087 [Saxophila tyrrhenica]